MLKMIIKQIINIVTIQDYSRVLLLSYNKRSGCNTTALAEFIKNEKYINVELIDMENVSNMKQKIKFYRSLSKSRIIISTHGIERVRKNQILIQLWHGIPLKSMGLMDKTISKSWEKNDKKVFDDVDKIITTSKFATTLMNSTIGQINSKYEELGLPRNDLLNSLEKNAFKNIFPGIDNNCKKIFFIPTFKAGYGNRIEGNERSGNFFGFDNFNIKSFNEYLKRNNYNLIVKLHPWEEKKYIDELRENEYENIHILSSDNLKKHNCDLYEMLSCSDMLITDYSSIFFDYLLTKKPILFINNDEEQYRKTRGFLLEPYTYWTPGPKVDIQDKLEKEIVKLLGDNNYYLKERLEMLDIFHKYKDNNSCNRIWGFIKEKYLN